LPVTGYIHRIPELYLSGSTKVDGREKLRPVCVTLTGKFVMKQFNAAVQPVEHYGTVCIVQHPQSKFQKPFFTEIDTTTRGT